MPLTSRLLKPHFVIGDPSDPYLKRWRLVPRNQWLNVYLHQFLKDDDDRALHDHPWPFVSVILKGGYREVTESGTVIRKFPSLGFRKATHRHRVLLFRGLRGQPLPCWTLIVTGPRCRTWGFWCPQGFVPWREFVDSSNHGNIGRGCG